MLVIRFNRIGKKNQPAYRVVLSEKKRAPGGKFIEILGHYNPRLKTKELKKERILYWLSKGAQSSPTVHNLLVSEKIIDAKKVKAWQPKKKNPPAGGEARQARLADEVKQVKEAEAAEEAKAEESNLEEKIETAEAPEVKAEAAEEPAEEAKAEEAKTAENVETPAAEEENKTE